MSNGGGGGVWEHAVILGEMQEARGNVESLRRRRKKWSAKLAECWWRGDITGGGHAGERVLEGNRRVREAQKAVEVLERELQGMGGEVQVKQEGGVNDDDIVELGEVVVDEKDEERRANPGVKREEEEAGGRGMGMGRGRGMTPAASCALCIGCATDLPHPWQQELPIFPGQGRW